MVVVGRKNKSMGWLITHVNVHGGDHWHVLVACVHQPASFGSLWQTLAVYSSATSNVSVSNPRARHHLRPLPLPLLRLSPLPAQALVPFPALPPPCHPKSLSRRSNTWDQRSLSSCVSAGLRLLSMAPNTTVHSPPVFTNASRNLNAVRLCYALLNVPTAA